MEMSILATCDIKVDVDMPWACTSWYQRGSVNACLEPRKGGKGLMLDHILVSHYRITRFQWPEWLM